MHTRTLAFAVVLFGACSNSPSIQLTDLGATVTPPDFAFSVDLTSPSDLSPPPAPADFAVTCADVETSNLAGVKLRILATKCTFTLAEVAAGIQLPWRLEVGTAVSNVVPSSDANSCSRPDGSGLIVGSLISGGANSYCVCDTGRCVPFVPSATTLAAGNFDSTVAWDGRNWNGPSDTNNSEGAPFSPGVYSFQVKASGTQANVPFALKATLDVHIVP